MEFLENRFIWDSLIKNNVPLKKQTETICVFWALFCHFFTYEVLFNVLWPWIKAGLTMICTHIVTSKICIIGSIYGCRKKQRAKNKTYWTKNHELFALFIGVYWMGSAILPHENYNSSTWILFLYPFYSYSYGTVCCGHIII